MSKSICKNSWLTCYNLLVFILIATTISDRVCTTTPKPSNGTRQGYPQAEINLVAVKKDASNRTTESYESPDLLEAAASVSNSQANKADDQDAAPSVTSVHQVWTSSSSGSLDELSPEVISKLRQDVPFLAAYALRPRLVGASGNSQQFSGSLRAPMTSLSSSSQSQVPSISSGGRAETHLGLLTAASSPQLTQSGVLGPRLGDISEYRVETSSTSKTEHHHKRKTSLKKKTDDELEMKRRQVLAASQLVARRPSSVKASKPSRVNKSGKKLSKGRSSKSRGGKGNRLRRKKNSKARTGRLRRKPGARGRARYYQEASSNEPTNEIDGDTGKGKMELESRSVGEQTTTLVEGETRGANERGRDSSGVKGGSSVNRSKQKPFYARSKPSDNPEEVGEDQRVSGGASGAEGSNRSATDVDDTDNNNDNGNVADDTVDNDNSEDDGVEAGVSEPKRVGDDDVEEEGDTVTVMPKSDGVDDDPDIGDAPPTPQDAEDGGELDSREPERENESRSSDNDLDSENKKRKVEREKPTPTDNNDGANGQSGGRASGDGTAAGGGIGATTGGASTGRDGDSSSAGGDNSAEGDATGGNSGVNSSEDDDRSTAGEGNEGHDNDRDSNNDTREDSSIDKSGGRTDERPGSGSDEPDRTASDEAARRGAEEFEPERSSGRKNEDSDMRKRPNSGDSPREKTDEGAKDDDIVSDVDYRDEMAEADRKQREKKTDDDKATVGRAKKGDKKECDEGSNDHHSDHHDHHNSIEWLRGAIPGEPGIDYPTLSGINKSDFNCREQKYPGYYADVDSRCQIFHICQADGRQDSFICPNGTIFSQISTVCVWWNSFDCEDAPNYYALNALLYKTPASSSNNNSPQGSELKPRDGARIEPKDRGVERGRSSGEESSIDDLIRAMRRSKEASEAEDRQTGVIYDSPKKAETMRGGIGADEATIQRKSTNLDDDSELTSSRLRSEAVPRRKRRASVKQAPPKLKSRRVSRNSRRRKLRHGIKPKRRA